MNRASVRCAIDELIKHYHMYGWFNGNALVAEKGEVLYEASHGMADFEWSIPNSIDTRFRIGSVTKQFTAMLVMQLVQQGKLSVTDTISRHLPSYRPDTGERITIHQLLNHTSGLPNYTASPDLAAVRRLPTTPADFVPRFCSGDLEFEPGAEFSYCNSGYYILGAIIEKLTGLDYETALRRMILEPAGLDETGYDRTGPLLPRRARGYERDVEDLTNAEYIDMSVPYAAGALYSSVHDLLRWDRELYGHRLLSAPLKRAMFTPGLANYAYGWLSYHLEVEHLDRSAEMLGVTGDRAGLHIIAHGGNIDGFAAAFCRVVSHEQVVVLLNNTGPTMPGQMMADILKLLHGRQYSLPKRPAAPELFGIAKADGIAEALKNYVAWRADPAGPYDTSLRELLRLARQCAKRGMGQAATQALEAAVDYFPDAELAQLELAAYLAKAGQAEAAAQRYRALLAAKPGLPGNVRRRIETELGRLEGQP